MDTQAENETTIWLSRQVYRDLKDGKEAKLKIDRVQGRMTYLGGEELTVEVNSSPMTLIPATDIPVLQESLTSGRKNRF